MINISNTTNDDYRTNECKYCLKTWTAARGTDEYSRKECKSCLGKKKYSIRKLKQLKVKLDDDRIEKHILKACFETDEITGNAINIRTDLIRKVRRLEELVYSQTETIARLEHNLAAMYKVVFEGDDAASSVCYSPVRTAAAPSSDDDDDVRAIRNRLRAGGQKK